MSKKKTTQQLKDELLDDLRINRHGVSEDGEDTVEREKAVIARTSAPKINLNASAMPTFKGGQNESVTIFVKSFQALMRDFSLSEDEAKRWLLTVCLKEVAALWYDSTKQEINPVNTILKNLLDRFQPKTPGWLVRMQVSQRAQQPTESVDAVMAE
jgi:hypothetical protein